MRTRMAMCLLAVAALAGGCSDDATRPDGNGNGNGDGDPPPSSATVSLQESSFSPSSVTIAKGGRVTWTNAGPVAHTITPNNAGQTGAWASETVAAQQGANFSHIFTTAGTFNYFCTFHSGMTGTVRVE